MEPVSDNGRCQIADLKKTGRISPGSVMTRPHGAGSNPKTGAQGLTSTSTEYP